MMPVTELNELSRKVIGAAFEVRKELGHYYRERIYQLALKKELSLIGIEAVDEYPMTAYYKGEPLCDKLKCDLLIEDEIIIETKALTYINEDCFRQLNSYLHVMNKRLGFLMNFGSKDFSVAKASEFNDFSRGIYRMVNGL